MTQQEQFEADYLAETVAVVPGYDFRKTPDGDYEIPLVRRVYRVWLQQAKRHDDEIAKWKALVDASAALVETINRRHEAEIAELVETASSILTLAKAYTAQANYVSYVKYCHAAEQVIAKHEAKK